jgi:hypothetical protein
MRARASRLTPLLHGKTEQEHRSGTLLPHDPDCEADLPDRTHADILAPPSPPWTTAMFSILAGIVLISIGLFGGDSIFRGEFSLFSVFFDGLGLFWIGKGIYGMVQSNRE